MPSQKFSHLLKSLFFLLSAFFLVFFLVLNLFSNSSLIGGFRTFLVQSGSMEPSINTGDVILISPQNSYHVNDVITFSDQNRKIVTHRIVEVKNGSNPSYITKGDANRAIDRGQVSSKNILGKVILVIPKVGFLVAFCRTLPGLLLTIVLPAALLIYGEIKKII